MTSKSLKEIDEKSIDTLLAKFIEIQRRRQSKKGDAKKPLEHKVDLIKNTESSAEEDEESVTDSYGDEDDDVSESASESDSDNSPIKYNDGDTYNYSDAEEKALIRMSVAKQSCFGISSQYRCNYTDAYLINSAHKNKSYGMKLFYRNMRKRLIKRHEIIENDRDKIADL